MERATFRAAVEGIAALDHPVSDSVYRFVRDHDGWVGRDETAATLELARSVAAFHLDKLVDAGLLEAGFERMSGRSGPGAGRPAKRYRPSPNTVALSIPERRYDLAGSLLAEAVAGAAYDKRDVRDALSQSARARGREVGEDRSSGSAPRRKSRPDREQALVELLEVQGYAPVRAGDTIALRNCPFHALANEQRELVCGMNREFLAGVIDGLGDDDAFDARLDPQSGYCCVRVEPRARPATKAR
ncbi:MAG TPA: transcriptional regulator [Acidimicrobiia bacterium]